MTPHVTCVCLTADRQQYTDRAVKNFLVQTYQNKSMLILDNGNVPYELSSEAQRSHIPVWIERLIMAPKSIGALRNAANRKTVTADIITHWDSDDYSHPLRLAWQVARLKEEGDRIGNPKAQAVGYLTMLFWRKADQTAWLFEHKTPGYAVGTSLMYWRKTWEANPFSELNIGEDFTWLRDKVGY